MRRSLRYRPEAGRLRREGERPRLSYRGRSGTSLGDGANVRGVGALLALRDLELDLLAFFQRTKALTGDAAVMNEDVVASLAGDEAEAFLVAEPFDGSAHVVPPSGALRRKRSGSVFEP